jgi:hypothetical protein
MMEDADSSETLVSICQTIRCHIQEHSNPDIYRHESLKSHATNGSFPKFFAQNSPKSKLVTIWGGAVCPYDVSKYVSAEMIYVS